MRHSLSRRPSLTVVVILLGLAIGTALGPADPPVKQEDGEQPAPWKVAEEHVPHRDLAFTVDEGTWLDLDVAPDGKEIVFSLLGDLYLLPIGGGKARALRRGLPFDVQPRFSPDGRWVAFTSDEGGGDNLWVVARDGTGARQISRETFRLLNTPAWTPDGKYVIGRKHFTSGRSIGAGEMWIYHVDGEGAGAQITSRRTQQKNSGEPCVSPDGKTLYYSDDVTQGQYFEYNRDPHRGIYAIKARDLTTGEERTIAGGPGGAVRPQISPDGKTLAFVRRLRFETALCLLDLATERVTVLWKGLSRDQQETWAIFGCYPGFDWTPDGKSLVIWAKGGLWRVGLDGKVAPIPFRADVKLRIAETRRTQLAAGDKTFRVKVCRWPAVSADRTRLAYTALGKTYVKAPGAPRRLTTSAAREVTPSWSPDGAHVVHATWTDAAMGAIERVALKTGERTTLTRAPGHYTTPRFSPDGTQVVFARTAGGQVRGSRQPNHAGIYVVPATGGEARLVTRTGRDARFSADGTRLQLLRRKNDKTALVSIDLQGKDERVLATSDKATEIVLSPDGTAIAFRYLYQAYVARRPVTGRALDLTPQTAAVPVRRLSRDCGTDLSFSADSRFVYWHHASTLRTASVDKALGGTKEARKHPFAKVESVIAHDLGFDAPADVPTGTLVFDGARIVTMRGDEIIEDGRIVVTGNRIAAVGPKAKVPLPAGATVKDVSGMVVIPGYVDVHSHMPRAANGMSPQASWPLLTNLAFGVTTLHDPSAPTEMVFAEAEMVRSGELLGPRIYSTGTILYGADTPFRVQIESADDARSHVRRLAAYGATSVKSYMQPRRDQRQKVVAACRELGINAIPEGGSTLFLNIGQIIDGHTTLEHALPVAPIYRDVITLLAKSGTCYTPTLCVGYGGWWGERYWYQTTRVWEHERLLRFVPRSIVEPRSLRREMVPGPDLHHIRVAKGVAAVIKAGGTAQLGGHGQMQGLCTHWEMWMFQQGGLSNHEALRAGTAMGARAAGLEKQLGTIAPGMLADLVFYAADKHPLSNIRNSDDHVWVMKNGRLYDADTLDQLLPTARKRAAGPRLETITPGPRSGLGCAASCGILGRCPCAAGR